MTTQISTGKTRAIVVVFLAGVLFLAGCDDGGGSGCPKGELNCPCDNGSCDGDLVCRDGFCVPGEVCPEGTAGCPCRAGNECDQGLVCEGGVCRPEGGAGMTVGNGEVRACDVLLEAGQSGLAAVAFNSAEVIGVVRREGARFALAFTARQDGALGGAVAWLSGAAGQQIDAGQVGVSGVTCYDRKGVAVDSPDLNIQ